MAKSCTYKIPGIDKPLSEDEFKVHLLEGGLENFVKNKGLEVSGIDEKMFEEPTDIQNISKSGNEQKPPISEPPKGRRIVFQRPPTELSHRGLQDVANEFSLPDVKTRDRKSDLELKTDAERTANEWATKGEYGKNIERLVQKSENGEILTDKERVILEQHLANVSDELRNIDPTSTEFDTKLAEIKRLKDAGEKTRSEAGAALRIPIGGSRPKSLSDFLVEEMDASGVDRLTDKQKETAIKEYDDLQKVQSDYEQHIQKLEEENIRLKAENELKQTVSKTKRQKKDFASTRKDLRDQLKAARKEHQDYLKDQGIQTMGVGGFTLKEAKIVAELVRSYVEEGVTKLADVVDKVYEEIKDIIPGVDKKDVHDVIAGEYKEQKTRSQLSITLRDLRDEASLINKYEALLRGEEPKSERKKIERNRNIKELRDKIKSFKDEEKEAGKFYKDNPSGESKRLVDFKKKIENKIDKIEEQLKTGDFSKEEKKPLVLDKEGKELQSKYLSLKRQREERLMKEEYAKSSFWNKAQNEAANILNAPRTLMASVDFSAPFRQGLFATLSHPVIGARAFSEMFKAAFSKKSYDQWFENLKNSGNYDLMHESGLAVTDIDNPHLSEKEEAYMSNLPQKIPIAGKLVSGSERAYSMFLNKMRADIFNKFAAQMQRDGKTFENSEKEYKGMAAFVNNITGRGDLGKTMNDSAPLLNSLFFSPRLLASRINTLTYFAQPRFWKNTPRQVRLDYFKGLLTTAGIGLTILGLAKAAGADTEDDPRSPDFGKIKSGNTRWDIWGGHQQYIRLAAQLLTNERKSSTSGRITEMGTKNPYSGSRGATVGGFLRGKLAPVPSLVADLLYGENAVGQKLTTDWKSKPGEIGLEENLASHLLPLVWTGMDDAIKDQGQKSWFTVAVPSIFGVSTQTYQGKQSKSNKR